MNEEVLKDLEQLGKRRQELENKINNQRDSTFTTCLACGGSAIMGGEEGWICEECGAFDTK